MFPNEEEPSRACFLFLGNGAIMWPRYFLWFLLQKGGFLTFCFQWFADPTFC